MKLITCILSLLVMAACTPKNADQVDTSVKGAETEIPAGCIDPAKIDKTGACTMQYEPVCGCDGKTYGNACVAEKSGLTYYTPGECGECIDHTKMEPQRPCTREYHPVCGCNGQDYANICLAKIAGVTTWSEGPCRKGDCIDVELARSLQDVGCPENWDPVCGCDGKTYGNECEARRNGILHWTEGECAKK